MLSMVCAREPGTERLAASKNQLPSIPHSTSFGRSLISRLVSLIRPVSLLGMAPGAAGGVSAGNGDNKRESYYARYTSFYFVLSLTSLTRMAFHTAIDLPVSLLRNS